MELCKYGYIFFQNRLTLRHKNSNLACYVPTSEHVIRKRDTLHSQYYPATHLYFRTLHEQGKQYQGCLV